MTVDIRWSGAVEEDPDFVNPFATNWTFLASGEWADCEANAQSAVNDLVENWCGETEWEEYFGAEATIACVLIEVHAPPSIAGRYVVDLERVVKARSNKVAEFPT